MEKEKDVLLLCLSFSPLAKLDLSSHIEVLLSAAPSCFFISATSTHGSPSLSTTTEDENALVLFTREENTRPTEERKQHETPCPQSFCLLLSFLSGADVEFFFFFWGSVLARSQAAEGRRNSLPLSQPVFLSKLEYLSVLILLYFFLCFLAQREARETRAWSWWARQS